MRTVTTTLFGFWLATTVLFAVPKRPMHQDTAPAADLYGSVIAQLKKELPELMGRSNVPGLCNRKIE